MVYEIEGERKGPVDGMAVTDLVASGVLGYGSRVWNREFGDWKPLEETRFREMISAPPPLTGTAVTLALNIGFSSLDEKRLQKAGHDTSRMGSSWIVPVYLFKRSRILKQSSAYFVVWIVCIVLVILD